MNEPATIHALLQSKTIAVIGLSDDPTKPSHFVSAYMQRAGHRILPIKPDLVNVFRLPRFIPAIVDEMIALHLPALWIQQGILHPEAAAKAEAHGIKVVMDRCIMIESRHV